MAADVRFELKPEHLRLLRASYVQRELSGVEFGAAEIDGKRPYGNSDVERDLLELLGWPESREAEAVALHGETPKALQIVLVTGRFQPGWYRMRSQYDDLSWEAVDGPPAEPVDDLPAGFELLEDMDGAPYPHEVQRLVAERTAEIVYTVRCTIADSIHETLRATRDGV